MLKKRYPALSIFKYQLIIMAVYFILTIGCKKEKNVPELVTVDISNITLTTASCVANITNDGDATITARGVCWSTNSNPTIADSKTSDGTGTGIFFSTITDLIPNTVYYVRAYATNSVGTEYGNLLTFQTAIVSDIDGNGYHIITIGTQTWMLENLKTTRYNDGTVIPNVTKNTDWSLLVTPGYCWYNNDKATYGDPYGALYNWFAIDTATNGNKNICPAGWHVPSDSEWTVLIDFLGGELTAGGKLKETGTTHWISPNEGATNESGFTALPGGWRFFPDSFCDIGKTGNWWCSDEIDTHRAFMIKIHNNYGGLNNTIDYKNVGCSVRCIKD